MTAFLMTSGGDLALTDGRLTFVDGPAEKAQKIRCRFRLFAGEWFLDTRVGVPFYDVVFGPKRPDLGIIQRLFQRIVESVPGIVEAHVDLSFDEGARELSYSFEAKDDEGNPITGSDVEPFIPKVS